MNSELNETWECYLCGIENTFNIAPNGYLANYHPLCNICADNVLNDETNIYRPRMTYHKNTGDIKMILNIPIEVSYPKLN